MTAPPTNVPSSGRAYRKRYEALMQPIGNFLAKLGFSANFITFTSVIFAFISAWFYSTQELFIALLFFLIATLLDLVDGSVARAHGATKFGYVLDPVVDRYVEWIILLGIMLSGYVEGMWVFFCFMGMIMASYIRTVAVSKANIPDMQISKVGMMERKEKLAIIGVGTFLQGIFPYLPLNIQQLWPSNSLYGPLFVAVIIVGIFSNISALQRLRFADTYIMTELKEQKK